MLKKLLALALLILTSLAIVYCRQTKDNREKTTDKNSIESLSISLKLSKEKP